MTKTASPSDSQRTALAFIKRKSKVTASELARHLNITREGARQQLQQLEQEGWIARKLSSRGKRAGRPTVRFGITPAGDHLFPKAYDGLAVSLVDTVAEQLGEKALFRLLAALTDQQVRQWETKLAGKTLVERIKALKGIYFEDDPHTAVQQDSRGYALIERNCPYLAVAMKRPRLCSVTVSTLTRLLGVKVVREESFQNGQQRCVFRVLAQQPADSGFTFAFEEPLPSSGG